MDSRYIYHKILRVVEYFVENAVHLTINELRNYNPSIAELAQDVRKLAVIMKALSEIGYDDEAMETNAKQCILELELLADIVSRGDEEALNASFQRLEMYTHAP